MNNKRGAHLAWPHQALDRLGHAAGVEGSRAAYALGHVHTIAALAAGGAVVLGAAEVHARLAHLREGQPLRAPVDSIGRQEQGRGLRL